MLNSRAISRIDFHRCGRVSGFPSAVAEVQIVKSSNREEFRKWTKCWNSRKSQRKNFRRCGRVREVNFRQSEEKVVSRPPLQKSKPLSLPMGKNLENGPSVGTVGRASIKTSAIAEEFAK